MDLEDMKDDLSYALQCDLEHGVRWLNEEASAEFARKYPGLCSWIEMFMEWEEDDDSDSV